MKFACISGRYLRKSRRAVSHLLASAAPVMRAISAGISLDTTEMIPTPPSPMTARRDGVVAGKNEEIFRHRSANFGDLPDVAAGFFDGHDVGDFGQAQQRGRFDIGSGSAGDVVQHQRLGRGFGNRLEVLVNAFLRGLVVVGRRGEDVVDARARRNFLCLGDGLAGVVGGCARHDGHAAAGGLDGQVDNAQPFVVRQSRRLASGAAGHKEVDARLDLPAHQFAQRGFVDAAILFEGSDKSGTTTTQFHIEEHNPHGGNLKSVFTTEDTESTEEFL